MEILNQVIKKNLHLNKQRTIVTIVGIVLTCALIITVMSMAISFQKTMYNFVESNYGSQHVIIHGIDADDVDMIQAHKGVTNISQSTIQDMQFIYDEEVYYANNAKLDATLVKQLQPLLIEGRVPNKVDEIVVCSTYAKRFGYQIGDSLTHDIGTFVQTNPNGSVDGFAVDEHKTYTIVGIANPTTFLNSYYAELNTYTFATQKEQISSAYITYDNPNKYEEYTLEILDLIGLDHTIDAHFIYNEQLLQWTGNALSSESMRTILTLAGFASLIIMLTSIYCIRNSFAISLTEKTKMIGMLKSVGATPKQIKNMVFKEGFYLGLLGIPLGILVGFTATFVLIQVVNYYLSILISSSYMFVIKFEFVFSFIGVLVAILLSCMTIFLSAYGSAHKASKITEIQAIKNSGKIKIKNKSMKIPKIIKKCFGIGGVFAYKNMKRNKSKFRVTILSLTVSIATFISLSFFTTFMYAQTEKMYGSYDYNLIVENYHYNEESNNNIIQTFIQEEHIENYSFVQRQDAYVEDDVFAKDGSVNIKDVLTQTYDGEKYLSINLVAVGEEEYERYINSINLQDNQMGVLIFNTIERMNAESEKVELQTVIDEKVTQLTVYNQVYTHQIEMPVVHSDKIPKGLETYFYSGTPTLIVSDVVFQTMVQESGTTYNQTLFINAQDTSVVEAKIERFNKNYDLALNVINIEEMVINSENMLTLFSIFLYGFIIVIILIGLTSIFNTLTTNMMLRSREFAILKSIGMTNNEFNRMIRLESILYGTKALFWGMSMGTLLSYALYKFGLGGNEFGPFHIPIEIFIIVIIFVFVIIYLFMRISISKINRQNTIETIKNENI